MLQVPDPAGKNQLAWAQAATRYLRDLDRRINAILPQRPRAIEETVKAKAATHPFKAIYPAPFTGSGEPPSNQPLKFSVRPGIVSGVNVGARLATNLNAQFTAADETEQFFCWIEANFVTTGDFVSMSNFRYQAGEEVPEPTINTTDPENVFPSQWCLPIFSVKTDGGAIVSAEQYINSSLSISLVVTSIACGRQTRSIFWSGL